jgi:anti-anti-sigma factor
VEPRRSFLGETRGRGECVIRPVGELTEETAPALRSSITHMVLEGARRIVLDLSLTSCIDASGRDALVRCSRAVRGADAKLVLTAAPDHVRELLRTSDAQTEVRERLAVELLVQTDEMAVQRARLEDELGRSVCGTFLHRTTTGHPLVCVLRIGHAGAHQWT